MAEKENYCRMFSYLWWVRIGAGCRQRDWSQSPQKHQMMLRQMKLKYSVD